MAQDAQLLLKVGLDLSTFRSQLATLGQAAAGYNLPIKLKFDRTAIKNELNSLRQSLGRQKFNIELNIVGGLTKDQFEKIQGRLDALSKTKAVEIPVGVRAAASQKDIQRVVAELNRSIKGSNVLSNTSGKLRAPVSIRAAITQSDIAGFKREVENKLSGIKIKVGVEPQGGAAAGEKTQRPGFEAARRQIATLGVEQLRASAFKRLGEESRSAQQVSTWLDTIVTQGLKGPAKTQQLNAVRDFLANALAESASRGIEARMMPLRRQSRISAPRSASNINTILDPIAGLTKNPRAARRMLRMLPEERITTDLLGLASRQASYLEQVPSARGMQRDIKGFDPLLKAISEQFTSYTKSLNPSNPWIGKIGDGMANIVRVASVAAAQKALPPIGGTSSRVNQSLFPVSGMMGPSSPLPPRGSLGQFPLAGMAYPSSPLGRITAQSSMFGPSGPFGPGNRPPGGFYPGGGGGGGGTVPPGGFPSNNQMGRSSQLGGGYLAVGQAINNFQKAYSGARQFLDKNRLPLGGAIADVAGEFGNAVKQVLLFGTAYKALAFITDLPNQAFEAAKSLATYENQLKAVTATTGTFEQSFSFVDSLAQRFNVPLESARQGFVKLYASMQPAGFNQQEIEGLFTGISKATAAFGLSSDKVDRVNYAFAQMASKGQIMSEELKGQLGDVLPGALALFARAAQMSIPEFSKAMEDGAFKGDAMQQVLRNVGILMNKDFGPAALGAAKTLQGALNQIQNNLKLMYESMTPIVNVFASAFGPQVNSLIKDVTAVMKVLTGTFVDGAKATETLSPRALALYDAIQQLKPSFQSAGQAIADLGNRLASLTPFLVQTIKLALDFIATPFARAAFIATIAITGLNGALQLLNATGLTAAIKNIYSFISGLLKIPQATGVARLGVLALKLAITGIFVGAILTGLDFLVGKILEIGSASDQSRKKTRELAQELDRIAGSADVGAASQKYMEANTELLLARKRNEKALQDLERAKSTALAASEPSEVISASFGLAQARAEVDKTYAAVIQARKNLNDARKARLNAVKEDERQRTQTNGQLEKIDLSGGDEKAAEKRRREQEKLANQQQQLAMDAASRENALQKAILEGRIAVDDQVFEHYKKLVDARVQYELAGLNSIEARQLKHQDDLRKIELNRIEAIRKASEKSQQATMEFTAAKRTAAAAGRGGSTGLFQGSTGVSSGPHFDVRRADGSRITEAEARALFSAEVRRQLTMTSGYGPRNTGIPGASTFHRGIDLAGPANTPLSLAPGYSMQGVGLEGGLGYAATVAGPQGQMYKVGHLQKPSASFTRQRRTEKAGGKLEVEQQQFLNQTMQAGLVLRQANIEAIENTRAAIAQNISTIFPVAEQKLENDLLELRNKLQIEGMSEEYIRMKEQSYKVDYESARALDVYTKRLTELQDLLKPLQNKKDKKQLLSPEEVEEFDRLTKLIGVYQNAIEGLPNTQRAFNEELTRTYNLAIAAQAPLNQISTAYAATRRNLEELKNWGYQAVEAGKAIGSAFGTAFKDVISGSASAQEALANMMQSIADHFLDMAAQIIAQQITMMIYGLILKALGIGGGLGSMGGGGGFGSFDASGGFGIGGMDLPGLGGAGALSPAGMYSGIKFANGGIASGGFVPFKAFASGGMVAGPTLGLVGEGKYNEAIVPLPDGRSIPVQLQDPSIRDKMGDSMSSMGGMPMLSMSFQSTTINGVEYVDRAQLEAAMAETRKISVREGATRGAAIALDKLANSPSSRRRVGLR